jgi:hypothetical protein
MYRVIHRSSCGECCLDSPQVATIITASDAVIMVAIRRMGVDAWLTRGPQREPDLLRRG